MKLTDRDRPGCRYHRKGFYQIKYLLFRLQLCLHMVKQLSLKGIDTAIYK